MSRIQINQNLQVGIDEIMKGIAQLSNVELEEFLKKIQVHRIHRLGSFLPKRELELLEKINSSMVEGLKERFNELEIKLENGTLTEAEREEFLKINEERNKVNDNRNEALIELAQLREIPIRELMKNLGIKSPLAK